MEYVDFEKLVKHKQTKCPCCSGQSSSVMDLPRYPLTEFYKQNSDKREPFGFIDQNVQFCSSCSHLFIGKILDARKIYNERNYLTSSISSKGAVGCIDEFVDFIKKTTTDTDLHGSTLVDIGGNDSTLLMNFIGDVNHLINIDPNAKADDKTIEVHREFLEEVNFSDFHGNVNKVFVSSHTIEHLEDPASLLRKLSKVVRDKDILYLQFPSLEKLVEQSRYDQICHQHINYFSLNSISKLMESEGLYIQKYEFDTYHFGTLRVKLTRDTVSSKEYKSFTESEIINSYSVFRKYYHYLNDSICDVFLKGQGFGAGLMVPTLSYNLPVIDQLSVIIDENPSKAKKKFINLNPPIHGIDKLDISSPVLMTSISTKATARAIFNKLTLMGVKDICFPSTII
jgi:hypothetical protein